MPHPQSRSGFIRFIPDRAWVGTASRWIRSICHGKRKSLTSIRVSSNWPARSILQCRTMRQFCRTALNKRKKALNGARVLVLGVAYKRDIDDLRESPALTIIEELQKQRRRCFYNDPYFPKVGHGRKYNLEMTCTPLKDLGQYDCVLIVTDHSDYDYKKIVEEAQLVVDSRNATKGIKSEKVVHC